MPHVVAPESIQLVQLGVPDLRRLAASEPVELERLKIPEGALPPAKTVARAVMHLDAGMPAFCRGAATVAIDQLLQLAASSDQVEQVVAHILPHNVASSKLAARLGFSPAGLVVDTDGELVTRWIKTVSR